MNPRVVIPLILAVLLGMAIGYWLKPSSSVIPESAPLPERRVLYWYDPMVPDQHFDAPGKSPFMDMELVPKYADDSAEALVRIDPMLRQNLGIRTAEVVMGSLHPRVRTLASVNYDTRERVVVQALAEGFVSRSFDLAVGDLIQAGDTLVMLRVPQWESVQREYLSLQRAGKAELAAAALERVAVLGLPDSLRKKLVDSQQIQSPIPVRAPVAGVIESLAIQPGMQLGTGQTLAVINPLSQVWLEAAVPEAQLGAIANGNGVEARFSALPGEIFSGEVVAILPRVDPATRTATVRAVLPNPALRLLPGMFADVEILGAAQPGLLVPTEAVIRGAQRNLVFIAEAGGFRPAEVALTGEANGQTLVRTGLQVGQLVVRSGQFLIESEARLSGLLARLETTVSDQTHQHSASQTESDAIHEHHDHGGMQP